MQQRRNQQPYRVPRNCLSLLRFQQIKKYLHLSDPYISLTRSEWYRKLEPLASTLQERFQKYYFPGNKVAIDEAMVRFFGRSFHTLKAKNKPIKQGYEVFCLCSHGYTYSLVWYSPSEGIAGLQKAINLSPTSSCVLQLAKTLPMGFRWDLLLDNYFTNIELFEELRRIGIGAAGTTRVDSQGFPLEQKIEKSEAKKKLVWGHLSGHIVQNTCCLVWQDNNTVFFMTTYHDIREKVVRNRRRPKKTSTNAALVRQVFGDNPQKALPIPAFIDDYNFHMGAVNISDQLRSYYSTQLRCRRNWLPLFFYLLDTTIINSHRIFRTLYPQLKTRSSHLFFRDDLANKLIEIGIQESTHLQSTDPEPTTLSSSSVTSSPSTSLSLAPVENTERTYYARRNTPRPPPIQYPAPNLHHYEQRPTRTDCLLCLWKKSTGTSSIPSPRQVYMGCQECNYALCRTCFSELHC